MPGHTTVLVSPTGWSGQCLIKVTCWSNHLIVLGLWNPLHELDIGKISLIFLNIHIKLPVCCQRDILVFFLRSYWYAVCICSWTSCCCFDITKTVLSKRTSTLIQYLLNWLYPALVYVSANSTNVFTPGFPIVFTKVTSMGPSSRPLGASQAWKGHCNSHYCLN